MLRRADADGGIVVFARLLLDDFDQALEIVRGGILRYDDGDGGIGENTDRRKKSFTAS
jgi:hypothetical protein